MLTFRKFHNASLVKIFIVFLPLICCQSYGNDLYENANCQAKNGNAGVCTKIEECNSVVNGLRSRVISYDNLSHCSFIGSTPVICCEDRTPSGTSTETPTRLIFTTKMPHTFTPRPAGNSSFTDLSLLMFQQSSTTKSSKPDFLNVPNTSDKVFWNNGLENNQIDYETTPKYHHNEERTETSKWFESNTKPINEENRSDLFWTHLMNDSTSTTTTKHPFATNPFFTKLFTTPSPVSSTQSTILDPWMEDVLESMSTTTPKTSHIHEAMRLPDPNIWTTTKTPEWFQTNRKQTTTTTKHPFASNPFFTKLFTTPSPVSSTQSTILDPWMEDVLKSMSTTTPKTSHTHEAMRLPDPNIWTTTKTPEWFQTNRKQTTTTTKHPFATNPFFTKLFTTPSPVSSTQSTILEPWMEDVLKSMSTTEKNKPDRLWVYSMNNATSDNSNELNSSRTENPDIYATPESRSGRKAASACEQYSSLAGPSLSYHILEGSPASPGEFPHMAAIGYPSSSGREDLTWDCGGSLISSRFVLTAAHCVTSRLERQPSIVRLGTISLDSNDSSTPVDFGISQVITHPSYTSTRQYHDIALLRLNQEVQFGDLIRPACLNTNTFDVNPSQRLIATGWGSKSTITRERSTILLQANLTLVSLSTCNQSHVESGLNRRYPSGLDRGQLCAFDPELRKDACEGDSGGPLQTKDDQNVYTIVGVTSFGKGCGTAVPGVYVRVAQYLDWIETVVW